MIAASLPEQRAANAKVLAVDRVGARAPLAAPRRRATLRRG